MHSLSLQREEASILDASGVRTTSVKDITSDFNFQRKLNPNLGQAVGHIVLSWSAKDKAKLNDTIMVERAKEYMHKMKIRDTQYIIVQHTDSIRIYTSFTTGLVTMDRRLQTVTRK